MSSGQQILDASQLIPKLGADAVADTLPHISDAKIFIVRISLRKGAEAARHDYGFLKEENAQGEETLWDKDARNKIAVGDWLGFILGENGKESVDLYQVVGEAPVSKRPVHWKRINSYTNQETATKPITRELIVLSSDKPTRMEWSDWKRKVDYKDKYVPRGTTSAKNPFRHDTTAEAEAAVAAKEESVPGEGDEAVTEEDEETTASMIEGHRLPIADLAKEIHILSELSGYGTLPEIQRRLSLLHKMLCAI